MKLTELKETARALFMIGVRAADPASAVKRALDTKPVEAIPDGRLILIAFGKASCAMIEQALKHVPQGQAFEALAVPNYENARDIDQCRVMAAGHPLPDENGLEAGKAVIDLLKSTTANDQVICLISGGGSALLPTLRDGLTLDDKIEVNKILLKGGLDIIQMNRIRQRLSVLKGGGLLEIAKPASVRSLIISDVVGDDLSIIASGPTVPNGEGVDPVELLKTEGLWDLVSIAAQKLLASPKQATELQGENELICTNTQTLNCIAQAAPDWEPVVIDTPLVGDVAEASQQILSFVRSAPFSRKQLFIWGGETTVKITGTGRGGRNQELAVRFAKLAHDLKGDWVFLSGGTDGRDGPTDAAGGVVTSKTCANAQANHINVSAALLDNDSYRILEAAGDLLKTEATGTNVADVQLFLRVR